MVIVHVGYYAVFGGEVGWGFEGCHCKEVGTGNVGGGFYIVSDPKTDDVKLYETESWTKLNGIIWRHTTQWTR